jgi:hypothetical protein
MLKQDIHSCECPIHYNYNHKTKCTCTKDIRRCLYKGKVIWLCEECREGESAVIIDNLEELVIV